MLSKTLANVSADAETRLKEQIDRHEMHDRGQAWISEGLGYVRDDACPFCGQNTKGLSLVEAYKQFFSDSYAALIDEIDQLQKSVETALGDTALATPCVREVVRCSTFLYFSGGRDRTLTWDTHRNADLRC